MTQGSDDAPGTETFEEYVERQNATSTDVGALRRICHAAGYDPDVVLTHDQPLG